MSQIVHAAFCRKLKLKTDSEPELITGSAILYTIHHSDYKAML